MAVNFCSLFTFHEFSVRFYLAYERSIAVSTVIGRLQTICWAIATFVRRGSAAAQRRSMMWQSGRQVCQGMWDISVRYHHKIIPSPSPSTSFTGVPETNSIYCMRLDSKGKAFSVLSATSLANSGQLFAANCKAYFFINIIRLQSTLLTRPPITLCSP